MVWFRQIMTSSSKLRPGSPLWQANMSLACFLGEHTATILLPFVRAHIQSRMFEAAWRVENLALVAIGKHDVRDTATHQSVADHADKERGDRPNKLRIPACARALSSSFAFGTWSLFWGLRKKKKKRRIRFSWGESSPRQWLFHEWRLQTCRYRLVPMLLFLCPLAFQRCQAR